MSDLQALLVVQDHDVELDQLGHRRATLPERADLAAIDHALSALERRSAEVRGQRDVLVQRQDLLEREIGAVRQRISGLEARMHSGEVTATRELTAMVEQVDTYRQRQRELEDEEIEAMEVAEPLDAEMRELDAERGELAARRDARARDLAQAEARLDAEISEKAAAREVAVAPIPDSLVKTYERLRQRLGGVGAARLEGTICSGCHLSLSAIELDQVRRAAPGTLVTCEQCGRILVP